MSNITINKKRCRETDAILSENSTVTSKVTAKSERNRKKKQKKRAQKRATATKLLRKADKKRGVDSDENCDAEGLDSREEVEAMLLDGHQVNNSSRDITFPIVPSLKKQRNFSADLKLYLDQWQAHQNAIEAANHSALQYSPWKFNKVLQAWALDHCLQKDRIPLETFKQLLLYIATVRGAARERLRDMMITILKEKDDSANPEVVAEVKRAKKVLITLGRSDTPII